jgi:hypothetical protein
VNCSVQGRGASKSRKTDLQNLHERHEMEEGNGDKSNKKSQGTMKIQKLGWLWC